MEISHLDMGGKYDDCIILDEYNGTISLCSGTVSGDKTYLRWCFPQVKDRKPSEKSIPWKITIGANKKQARETLEFFLAELDGKPDWAPPPFDGPEPDDSSIPF